MTTRKLSAVILLSLGITFLAVGFSAYHKSQQPNGCILNFSKSLGGKASLEFKNSIQQERYYGIATIAVGIIFTLSGGVLLFKMKK